MPEVFILSLTQRQLKVVIQCVQLEIIQRAEELGELENLHKHLDDSMEEIKNRQVMQSEV